MTVAFAHVSPAAGAGLAAAFLEAAIVGDIDEACPRFISGLAATDSKNTNERHCSILVRNDRRFAIN
jgi:hypothetical protein